MSKRNITRGVKKNPLPLIFKQISIIFKNHYRTQFKCIGARCQFDTQHFTFLETLRLGDYNECIDQQFLIPQLLMGLLWLASTSLKGAIRAPESRVNSLAICI